MSSILVAIIALTACHQAASRVTNSITNESGAGSGCCSCGGECDSGEWAPDADTDTDTDTDSDSDADPVDTDGDGFPSYEDGGTDCDDGNAAVNAEVAETCGDGIDNDCDGEVDEGVVWYRDADADGYGDPDAAVSSCDPPAGYVADGTDCDDTDAQVFPAALELCDDGADNDCDGLTDGDDDCA